MKLSDLIAQVGDENIQVQYLTSDLVRARIMEYDAQVTFATSKERGYQLLDAAMTGNTPDQVGLIVWIPAAKWPKPVVPKA